MQILYFLLFIAIPIFLAYKFKFSWLGYFVIFIMSALTGGVIAYMVFDLMHGTGLNDLINMIVFYALFIGIHIAGLYAVITNFVSKKIPSTFLWVNIGFLLITLSFVSVFILGSESVFGLYNKYFGLEIFVMEIKQTLHNLLLLISSGLIFGVLGLIINFVIRKFVK